jgi:hypothetical protein
MGLAVSFERSWYDEIHCAEEAEPHCGQQKVRIGQFQLQYDDNHHMPETLIMQTNGDHFREMHRILHSGIAWSDSTKQFAFYVKIDDRRPFPWNTGTTIAWPFARNQKPTDFLVLFTNNSRHGQYDLTDPIYNPFPDHRDMTPLYDQSMRLLQEEIYTCDKCWKRVQFVLGNSSMRPGFVTVRCCNRHRTPPVCDLPATLDPLWGRTDPDTLTPHTVIRSISYMIGTPHAQAALDPIAIQIVGLLQALAFVRRTLGHEIALLISNILLDHSAFFLDLPTEPTPMDIVVSHFEWNRWRYSQENYCRYVERSSWLRTMDHVRRCWECGARTPFQCGLCQKQTPICNEDMCKRDHYQLHRSVEAEDDRTDQYEPGR